MSWTSKEAQQIGRIEGKIDALSDIPERVGSLERFRSWAKGASWAIGSVVTLIAMVAFLLAGCATAHTRCKYEDSALVYVTARSTVIGKGTVEATTTACERLQFKSADGGISDNARGVIEDAVKAGVVGLVPGGSL